MDPNTPKDHELVDMLKKRRAELQKKKEPAFAGEQVTFEDIKPYVSMYHGDDGKMVYDVLDKDEKSAFKTTDSKKAMDYLAKNFKKLRMSRDEREISQIMKYENQPEAQEEAEAINTELDRIKTLANLS